MMCVHNYFRQPRSEHRHAWVEEEACVSALPHLEARKAETGLFFQYFLNHVRLPRAAARSACATAKTSRIGVKYPRKLEDVVH